LAYRRVAMYIVMLIIYFSLFLRRSGGDVALVSLNSRALVTQVLACSNMFSDVTVKF
jgi:hypothetical protein